MFLAEALPRLGGSLTMLVGQCLSFAREGWYLVQQDIMSVCLHRFSRIRQMRREDTECLICSSFHSHVTRCLHAVPVLLSHAAWHDAADIPACLIMKVSACGHIGFKRFGGQALGIQERMES